MSNVRTGRVGSGSMIDAYATLNCARKWLEENGHEICGVTFLDETSRLADVPFAFYGAYALIKAWYNGMERKQVLLVVYRDGSFKPFYTDTD